MKEIICKVASGDEEGFLVDAAFAALVREKLPAETAGLEDDELTEICSAAITAFLNRYERREQ